MSSTKKEEEPAHFRLLGLLGAEDDYARLPPSELRRNHSVFFLWNTSAAAVAFKPAPRALLSIPPVHFQLWFTTSMVN